MIKDKKKVAQIAKVLKTIAHPQKLEILMLLGCKQKLFVSEIQKEVGLTQSMTSQHLLAMKAQGIVCSAKKANVVMYYIANKNVLKVISCMKNCSQQK
ncbi:MAG: metalloregulator ArsR/SmtB family transcription factor [Candidatus Omnitrophica bacterium]|nr:metalloregulator ArsR/SmtB family transcription factor [Candidatus Omnitrophota bacterium]